MREAAPRRGRGGDGRAPPERPRPPAPRPRRPIRRRMKSWTRAPGAVRRPSIWKRGRAVSRNRPSFAARRASGAPREGGAQSPDRSGVGPHGGRVGPRCGLGPSPDAGGGWSHRASVDEGEAVVRASGGGQALPRRRCRTGRRRRRARRSETTVARACGDTFRTRSTHAGDLPSRCAPPGASRSSAAATQPADPRFRGPSAWRSGSPPGFRPRRRGSRTPAPPADRRECRRAGRPPARMRRPRPRRRRSMQLHAVISCGSWLPWANSLTAWAAPAFSTVSVEKSVKISLRTAEKSLGFKGVLHC